jgi:hypothetical protein
VSQGLQPQTPSVGTAAGTTQLVRVPGVVDDVQVNHCRMPSCANFGIPARTAPLKRGRRKGQSAPPNLPGVAVASCPNQNCANHGQAVMTAPAAYL